MTAFVFIKSIPMSPTTKTAVRANGGSIQRASQITDEDAEFIWNWGQGSLPTSLPPIPLWNESRSVRVLRSPQSTAEHLRDLSASYMETPDNQQYWWLKGPGRGGNRVVKVMSESRPSLTYEFRDWTIQPHINGTHFRLHTVGPRVVQCHIKEGDHRSREYRWIRMREVPECVKVTARQAAVRLPSPKTVVGWDMVCTDHEEAFVLEGNSAPGLNEATVERIVREIRRQEAEANEEETT